MELEFWRPGPIPAVDPSDLRKVWDFMSSIPDKRSVATGIDIYKSICRPGADVVAVCQRATLLQLVQLLGMLSRWLNDGHLDDAVINVAADFPMNNMEVDVIYNDLPFDVQEFLKRVDAPSGKAGA